MPQCTFNNCNEPIDEASSKEFCILHSKGEKSSSEFASTLKRLVASNLASFYEIIAPPNSDLSGIAFPDNTNFSGSIFGQNTKFTNSIFNNARFNEAIFSGDIEFTSATFSGAVDFREAVFNGGAIFEHSKFVNCDTTFHGVSFKAHVYFQHSSFSGKRLDFGHAKFFGRPVRFEQVTFQSDETFFDDSICENNEIFFAGSTFECDTVLFDRAKYINPDTNFSFCTFKTNYLSFLGFECKNLNFTEAKFDCDEITFRVSKLDSISFFRAKVNGRMSFENFTLRRRMFFAEMVLSESAYFSIKFIHFDPVEVKKGVKPDRIEIVFRETIFPKFQTYFESIGYPDSVVKSKKELKEILPTVPLISFDNCQLQDVYFIGNNMIHFTFNVTMIGECRFIDNDWYKVKDRMILKYERQNILYDEIDPIRYISINKPRRVLELYIQLKASHDRSNDYVNAGLFYFNQMEAQKKLYLRGKSVRNRLLAFIYSLYKVFAGYGQKPVWSFFWLIAIILLFSFVHLAIGFYDKGTFIQYFTADGTPMPFLVFLSDWAKSLYVSALHLLPLKKYLLVELPVYHAKNNDLLSSCVSFFNSISLFVLLTFILIGVQRHFKRF